MELTIGGLSQVFLALCGALTSTMLSSGSVPTTVDTLSNIAFLIFAILLWISIRRTGVEFRISRIGIGGSLLGVLGAAIGISVDTIVLSTPYTSLTSPLLITAPISLFFTSTTMILVGVFFLLCHEVFSNSELWIVAGMMYVAAGALIMIGTYFALAVMAVAGIMGSATFFASKDMRENRPE